MLEYQPQRSQTVHVLVAMTWSTVRTLSAVRNSESDNALPEDELSAATTLVELVALTTLVGLSEQESNATKIPQIKMD